MIQIKRCTQCEEKKPFSEFHRHKRGRFGLQPSCKTCISAYSLRHYQENREEIKARALSHYHSHKVEWLERQERWRKSDAGQKWLRNYYKENAKTLQMKRRERRSKKRAEKSSITNGKINQSVLP